MTTATLALDAHDPDAGVVCTLSKYVTSSPARSFFLTAGAGSGKTWTLTRLLQRLTGTLSPPKEPDSSSGPLTPEEIAFRKRILDEGRRIGVITYTNVACDQIRIALGQNPLAEVQTIHSFCWSLIRGFNDDIKEVLREKAHSKVQEAEAALAKANEDVDAKQARLDEKSAAQAAKSNKTTTGAKEAAEKALRKAQGRVGKCGRDLEKATRRLVVLDLVETFNYNPDVGREDNGSLSHGQVLDLAPELLIRHPTLGRVLSARYPVLLIDECQDTDANLLNAFRKVADGDSGFVIGLIGDPRQRVYLTGANRLASLVPQRSELPALRNNRRSGRRIVTLINLLWDSVVHGRGPGFEVATQVAVPGAPAGHVRLFIGRADCPHKPAAERGIAELMAGVTGQPEWANHDGGYLVLVLEHELAAVRGGFSELLRPLKSGYDLLRKELPRDLRVFEEVEMLLAACGDSTSENGGAVMGLLLKHSPLLRSKPFGASALEATKVALESLLGLWANGADPCLGEVAKAIDSSNLLDLSDALKAWCEDPEIERPEDSEFVGDSERASPPEAGDEGLGEEHKRAQKKAKAIAEAMKARWSQWLKMTAYFRKSVGSATHQGMKGAEHHRILGVLDDAAADGNTFAYDRFFGADLSASDTSKAADEENSIDRTRRLLYVVCSRARDSLALVLWSQDPERARSWAIGKGWFEAEEIELIVTPGPSQTAAG